MAFDDVAGRDFQPQPHHVGTQRQRGHATVGQNHEVHGRRAFAGQPVHHLQRRVTGVEHIVHHEQGVVAQVERGVVRRFGELRVGEQQREVVGVAFDRQVQPQRRDQAMALHHALAQAVGQRRAPAQHAHHRHRAATVQQSGRLLCHAIHDGVEAGAVVETGSGALGCVHGRDRGAALAAIVGSAQFIGNSSGVLLAGEVNAQHETNRPTRLSDSAFR